MAGMTMGQPAKEAVGPSGAVVGNQGSSLMNTVTNVIMAGVALNALEGGRSTMTMRPGDSLVNTLGGGAEVYSANPNSNLTKAVVGVALLGIVGKLLETTRTPEPTQEQIRQQMIAKDDAMKAELYKEDARKQEALAEDERRKAFFANKRPGM